MFVFYIRYRVCFVVVVVLNKRNSERHIYSMAVEVSHSLCFLKTMCKKIIYLDF